MKCDIVMPVWNQLAFTKDCVESVLKNTDSEYRLIIVDNASDEPTREYINGLAASNPEAVTILRNETNTGFVKAANKGIAESKAPYICILNNDTIVAKGWLGEMIRVAEAKADIGIVNPSSNNLGQKPADGEPMALYAERITKGKSGSFVELGAAIGFCMLIKRSLIERIGVFDEIYGMGNFEDTDFSRRAAKEGFRSVRAAGAYVYHREGSSFGKVKTFEEDFKRNKEIYEFRWGRPKRLAYIIGPCDDNALKRLGAEWLRQVRHGNWVWCLSAKTITGPEHSNIISVVLSPRYSALDAIFRILKRKKHFDEIFVGDERLGEAFSMLTFIHKAKVKYY